MSNPKAQASHYKDKGNTAFKGGDYPSAIGHYTSAILADATDVTFPLNRAAAYLKLGKYDDAERDCTAVLRLSSGNVKALFRRGQARVGNGKLLEAQKDFREALSVEPTNASAQEELNKVAELIRIEKTKKSKAPSSLQPPNAPVKRRRVPIKIFDPSQPLEKPSEEMEVVDHNLQQDILKSISSRPLKPSTTTSSSVNTVPTESSTSEPEMLKNVSSRSLKPSTPVDTPSSTIADSIDAKQTGSRKQTARAGGGVFRKSGENTIFKTRGESNEESADKDVKMVVDAGTQIVVPTTLFEFAREWNSTPSDQERWNIICSVQPTQLPTLCKTSLEPALLVSILETFLTTLTSSPQDTKSTILAYMDAFTLVPRFSTLLLFLSQKEKAVACRLWKDLGIEVPSGPWKAVA